MVRSMLLLLPPLLLPFCEWMLSGWLAHAVEMQCQFRMCEAEAAAQAAVASTVVGEKIKQKIAKKDNLRFRTTRRALYSTITKTNI